MYMLKGEVAVAMKLFLVLCVTTSSFAYYDSYYDLKPLFLTPYLQSGSIQAAKDLSKTYLGGRLSYSGYLTTDQTCGNNLHMWFFPADVNWNSAPIILWLSGGAGYTTMRNLFAEVGPWNYLKYGNFVKNNYAWTKDHNVLFIDQPVGTGFSFTKNDCYPTNMTEVTSNLYDALDQFFTMFQNLQKNKFFLAGERFAGHYGLELAVKIDEENDLEPDSKINLIGVLIGNPQLDPECDLNSDMLYQLGIISQKEWREMKGVEKEYIEAIENKNFSNANRVSAGLSYDIPDVTNILYNEDSVFTVWQYSLHLRNIFNRESLHVGYTPFFDVGLKPLITIFNEYYTSQIHNIEYLLKADKYIVGFYSGQLDSELPVTTTSCALSKLSEDCGFTREYLNATRTPWGVSGRLAGWTRTAGNLLEVVVRAAGQYVPLDQGEAALDLIKTVVSSTPGNIKQFGPWQ